MTIFMTARFLGASARFLQNLFQVSPARAELIESKLEPMADHLLVSAIRGVEVAEGRLQFSLRD
jgi:hypothetical protein